MLLTAHGGALSTGRNTHRYFNKMENMKIDAIEVDIYKKKDLLYISHLPKFFPKGAITLNYVFEYIKKTDFMLNCDVKMSGIAEDVLKLAKEYGIENKIIFTGSIKKKDIPNIVKGQVYLNAGFFPYRLKIKNLGNIKRDIESLNNDNIKGINLNYRFCTEEFLEEAKKAGLKLSVFTVDKFEVLERLTAHSELANITTNRIDTAIELLNK